MKLYERLGDTGFHSSVEATFGIDFDAYENMALARLRGAGCRNNLVIADDRMLAYALGGASVLPRWAGRHYSVSGAGARGVFHPKLILQVGRSRGRLIVASANATAAGLAGNLELAGILECTDEPGAAQELVVAAWQFLSRFLDRSRQHISQQIAWMEARARWLTKSGSALQSVTLDDGTEAAFLATGQATGVLHRLSDLVGDQPVSRLVVMSPYWDEDLAALRELVSVHSPQETVVLIDPGRALFPTDKLGLVERVRVVDIGPASSGRFAHAKLIVASTSTADHVLYGSANCTVAALGLRAFAGRNEEACLYRRLPPGRVFAELALAELLSGAGGISAEMLPPLVREVELPLDDAASRSPGSFECAYETLTWWPPEGTAARSPAIELLDKEGNRLDCELRPLPESGGSEVRFRLGGAKERPAFARLRFDDGTMSQAAVVASVEALVAAARESQSKSVERARGRLDEETEIDLSLLEVLDDLEAADSKNAAPVQRKAGATVGRSEDQPVHRVLDYESFLAGREIRSERAAIARDSLVGSEQSSFRAFLNRVLAVNALATEETEVDESEAIKRLTDLGDETGAGDDALERGESFSPPPDEPKRPLSQGEQQREAERRRVVQRRANREQLAEAVSQLAARLRLRASDGLLQPQDLLRVRAILLIVAAAGWSGRDVQRSDGHGQGPHSERQVLPVAGSEDCWPRLLGRTLHALFGGHDPPVKHLKINAVHDQIPDDVLECWATCFWAAQSSVAACANEPDQHFFADRLKQTVQNVYVLAGLGVGEALGEDVMHVMQRTSKRYAERLGLDTDRLIAAHRQAVMTGARVTV